MGLLKSTQPVGDPETPQRWGRRNARGNSNHLSLGGPPSQIEQPSGDDFGLSQLKFLDYGCEATGHASSCHFWYHLEHVMPKRWAK